VLDLPVDQYSPILVGLDLDGTSDVGESTPVSSRFGTLTKIHTGVAAPAPVSRTSSGSSASETITTSAFYTPLSQHHSLAAVHSQSQTSVHSTGSYSLLDFGFDDQSSSGGDGDWASSVLKAATAADAGEARTDDVHD